MAPGIARIKLGNIMNTKNGTKLLELGWGKPVPFQAVSSMEIDVRLDADVLREAGRFDLVVKNPEPLDPFYVRNNWGNGTSNVAHLIVNYKY